MTHEVTSRGQTSTRGSIDPSHVEKLQGSKTKLDGSLEVMLTGKGTVQKGGKDLMLTSQAAQQT